MAASVELLERIPLFAGLDRRELERIGRTMKPRTFAAGDTVASEGTGGAGFFVIEDGRAKVSVHGEERGTLGPGDYFGEVALIDEGARSATITAETDLRCYGLTPWEFRPLAQTNASVAWNLAQMLAKRLRTAEHAEV
ncbi:MAG: cyclic nucleotide-binding domain-containing protein [Actinomycetota bacterium]|nr:cyclic nucleotide-binding domain-containing protein [Actinomycetota bacterium]